MLAKAVDKLYRRAGRVLLVRPAGGALEPDGGTEDSACAAFARLTPQEVSEREVAAATLPLPTLNH